MIDKSRTHCLSKGGSKSCFLHGRPCTKSKRANWKSNMSNESSPSAAIISAAVSWLNLRSWETGSALPFRPFLRFWFLVRVGMVLQSFSGEQSVQMQNWYDVERQAMRW